MTERPAIGIGLMSGTSLDGMDAALVRFHGPMHAELLGFTTRGYSRDERDQVRHAIESGGARDLALLHARLGDWACDAIEELLGGTHVGATDVDFIGFHGQTIWHEPPAVTWQLGEPAVIVERFGRPVVANFRARDVAAGGQGAPLVPAADVLLFGAPDGPRVLLNIGGMANFTFVPRRAEDHGAFAFDTGPGMALVDAVARLVDPSLPYDVDARLASAGTVDASLLEELLADPFFAELPPRSTGRERFGDALARTIHQRCPGPDGVATAAMLSIRSIHDAVVRWTPTETPVVVSGGGARHPVIHDGLARALSASGRELQRFDTLFFSGDAKEAVAFALLAYLTLHGQPGNIPACTGASGARVLGTVVPA